MRGAIARRRRQMNAFARRCLRYLLQRVFFPMFYYIGCLRKIDPKLIFFVNESETWPGDNFRPIMERLTAMGYRCVHYGRFEGGRIRQYLQLIRFYLAYARAHALFLSDVCRMADSCRPRRGTAIVQLWHGCGAFKKWGWSTVDLAWGPGAATYRWFRTHRNYTYACVSTPEVIPHYAEAFNCDPAVMVPWGAPRTDIYFVPDIAGIYRRKVLEAFPEIGTRKIVLYAPTFRGNSVRKSRHDDVLDYGMMSDALSDTCALLLKPHPRSRKSIPAPEPGKTPFVFDAMALPIEVLLCAADLVVSDYSSLIFEYALLGRPMLFFAYDLANYDKARSFYYPYMDFVPGELAWDTEDVIGGIRDNLFGGKFDPARVEAFRDKFMSACDGRSTERIIKNVLGV